MCIVWMAYGNFFLNTHVEYGFAILLRSTLSLRNHVSFYCHNLVAEQRTLRPK